jgi:hypothetical protein
LGEATLDQLHDIAAFAERLKEAAMIEMWGHEPFRHPSVAREGRVIE